MYIWIELLLLTVVVEGRCQMPLLKLSGTFVSFSRLWFSLLHTILLGMLAFSFAKHHWIREMAGIMSALLCLWCFLWVPIIKSFLSNLVEYMYYLVRHSMCNFYFFIKENINKPLSEHKWKANCVLSNLVLRPLLLLLPIIGKNNNSYLFCKPVWQWCAVSSWPSLFLNQVMLNVRDPQRMTVPTFPSRRQVSDAVIVIWDLPIPLLHSSPLSASQWNSAIPRCPVILRNVQWENPESFIMRSNEIFETGLRTVPFQCERGNSSLNLISTCKQFVFWSTYVHADTNGIKLYLPQSAVFTQSQCLSMLINAELYLCLVATWYYIVRIYTNIFNPSSLQVWDNIYNIARDFFHAFSLFTHCCPYTFTV